MIKTYVDYKHGWIFGREAVKNEIVLARPNLDKLLARIRQGETRWKFEQTPLKDYGGQFNDVDLYLKQKAQEASRRGEVFRILDIGPHTGDQWKTFIEKNPNVELYGAGMEDKVKPHVGAKGFKQSLASNLHAHFQPDFFDFVITHLGIHYQPIAAIENAIHLLKPGGEAIFTMLNEEQISRCPNYLRYFRTLHKLKKKKEINEIKWSLHIRKHKSKWDKAKGWLLAKIASAVN